MADFGGNFPAKIPEFSWRGSQPFSAGSNRHASYYIASRFIQSHVQANDLALVHTDRCAAQEMDGRPISGKGSDQRRGDQSHQSRSRRRR